VADAEGPSDASEPSRPVDRFRRSAAGSVVAAGLLGLRDALEGRPEREASAVVSEARTPDDNGPIEVILDFDRPGHGIVVIHRDPVVDEPPHEVPVDEAFREDGQSN
jgi:hypothetical protein